MSEQSRKPLRMIDVALYGIVLIVGPNWIAMAAAVGPAALPMWFAALAVFFFPLAIASLELTERYTGEGGLYLWVRETLGPFAGFLCGWSYWTSLLPQYATQLFFMSSLILRAGGGDTHDAHLYLALSLSIALAVMAVELSGFRYGKWLTNAGATGTWIIFAIILCVAMILLVRGTSATHFAQSSYLPHAGFGTAILWSTMVFGFGGVETVGFLRNEIAGGMRTILRAVLVMGLSVVAIYMIGTVAFLVILPTADLTRLSGFPSALVAGLGRTGLPGLAPYAIGLMALTYIGGFAGWFGVGARLPHAAGVDHFLPPVFARRNPKTGAPTAAILLQGAMAIFFVLLSQAGESVGGTYDLLVAMTVLTGAIPYAIVFMAYLKAARLKPVEGAWTPPGGARTSAILAIIGIGGTLAAIGCSLVPSDGHDPLGSFFKVFLSALGLLLVGAVLYLLSQRQRARLTAKA